MLARGDRLVTLAVTEASGVRRGLNRPSIVAAAIEIADAEGLTAVSMTAGPAPRVHRDVVYRHVAGKDELLLRMAHVALGPPLRRRSTRDSCPGDRPHCAGASDC